MKRKRGKCPDCGGDGAIPGETPEIEGSNF
jgi:hypothetical protein